MPIIPDTTTAIIYAICILAGIVGVWVFQNYALPWIQKYQNSADQKKTEDQKKIVQDHNTQANSDSDKLKDIEGR